MFRTGGKYGLESIASSGQVIGNHFSHLLTGAILAGGYAEPPSKVLFKGNRSVENGLGGLLLNGASAFIPEHGDQLSAVVRDNDLSRNVDFGVRLFVIFRVPGFPGDTQATGNIHAFLKGNLIRDNFEGVMIDAGFPFRELEGGECDPRFNYSGSVTLRVEDNTVTGSADSSLWILTTRWPGVRGTGDFMRPGIFCMTRESEGARHSQGNFGHIYDGSSGSDLLR